jgi:hypothetical protein
MQDEFQREREDMLDTIRELARQLKLKACHAPQYPLVLCVSLPLLIPPRHATCTCATGDACPRVPRCDVARTHTIITAQNLIIENFIPPEEMQKLERR